MSGCTCCPRRCTFWDEWAGGETAFQLFSKRRKHTRPPVSPATNVRPCGATAAQSTPPSQLKVHISAPVSRSHTFSVLSYEPETTCLPSGVIATANTESGWPSSVRSCRPVSRSHTFEHQHVLLEGAQDLGKADVVGYLEFLGEHVQDMGDLSGVQALDRQLRTAGLVTGVGCGSLRSSSFIRDPETSAGRMVPAFAATLSVRINDTLRVMAPWWPHGGPVVGP